MPDGLLAVHDRLLARYGPQHWWPGETPFEIMVGAVLTQNTAWSNVERAIAALEDAGVLDARRLLALPERTLAGLIRPAGYFNVKARRLCNFCEWYIGAGEFAGLARLDTATLRRELLSVNGVGPETADDILLYAFERPVFVIDAYTRRLFGRLGMVDAAAGYEVLRGRFEEAIPREMHRAHGVAGAGDPRAITALFNEYHALIVMHAKHVCRSKPLCEQCSLERICPGRARGESPAVGQNRSVATESR